MNTCWYFAAQFNTAIQNHVAGDTIYISAAATDTNMYFLGNEGIYLCKITAHLEYLGSGSFGVYVGVYKNTTSGYYEVAAMDNFKGIRFKFYSHLWNPEEYRLKVTNSSESTFRTTTVEDCVFPRDAGGAMRVEGLQSPLSSFTGPIDFVNCQWLEDVKLSSYGNDFTFRGNTFIMSDDCALDEVITFYEGTDWDDVVLNSYTRDGDDFDLEDIGTISNVTTTGPTGSPTCRFTVSFNVSLNDDNDDLLDGYFVDYGAYGLEDTEEATWSSRLGKWTATFPTEYWPGCDFAWQIRAQLCDGEDGTDSELLYPPGGPQWVNNYTCGLCGGGK